MFSNLISGQAITVDSTYQKRVDKLIENALEFHRVNHDSLSYSLKSIKELAYNYKDIASLYDVYNLEAWSANYFDYIDQMKQNFLTLDSLTKEFKGEFNKLTDKVYRNAQLNYTKGQYYEEIADYEKARHYFKKIVADSEKTPDSLYTDDLKSFVIECNIYLAFMEKDESKYALAEDYLNKNIRLIKDNEHLKGRLYNTQLHLANIYSAEGNYKKAIKTILDVTPYYKARNPNSHRVMVNFNRLVENYLKLKKPDSARYYLEQFREAIIKDSTKVHLYYNSLSEILKAEGNYKGAILALQEFGKQLDKNFTKDKEYDAINNYLKIGKIQLETNDLKKAIDNFDLALNQFPKDSVNSTINQTLKFKILKNKIKAQNALGNHQDALATTEEAILILNALRPTFKIYNDKLFLQENAFPLFENAIAASFNLYQNINDDTHLKNAFYYFEKSKATLMLEALLSSKAETFANVPEELLERDKQLRAQINNLEKSLQKKDDVKLQDKVFDLKKQQRELITTIETEYKDYYNLKYNSDVLHLEDLQKSIKDETYLSFFFGNNHVYSLGISKGDVNFNRLAISEELKNTIFAYRDILQNPNSSVKQLKQTSSKLYDTFLNSSLKQFDTKRLVIIPDGLLNFMPFETLVNSNNNYLIEDTSVSYGLSATLINQLQDITTNNTQVLAFAPNFKGTVTTGATRSELLPLVHTEKEVGKILNEFKGQSFVGKDATLDNFYNNANKYGIIHLATHAVVNDTHPDYSYLAFSNKTSEIDNILYASDIYNTTTNANMITLSACETGVGSLKRGEGAISLARSFFYSGAASITSTLWKINDASSSTIMSNFYKNLANSNTKDKALQNAKLDYLKAHKDTKLAHPYYWSGFIVSGNVEPLASTNYWLWIGISFTFLLAIFIYNKKKALI